MCWDMCLWSGLEVGSSWDNCPRNPRGKRPVTLSIGQSEHSMSLTVSCMLWGRCSPVAATCWHGSSACAIQASPQRADMPSTGSFGRSFFPSSNEKAKKERRSRGGLLRQELRAQAASLGVTKATAIPTSRRQSPRPARVDGLACPKFTLRKFFEFGVFIFNFPFNFPLCSMCDPPGKRAWWGCRAAWGVSIHSGGQVRPIPGLRSPKNPR